DRRLALQQPPRDSHLDRLAGDIDVESVAQRERIDEVAAVEDVLDEALLDEMADRLAHRAATRLQLAREVHLAQVRAGRDRPVDDRVAQDAVNLPQRRRPLDRSEVPDIAHTGASCQIDLQTDIWENRPVRSRVNRLEEGRA